MKRKVINLGKIDYLGIGRKTCPVEIEIELRDREQGPELSICGTIWNHKHTDCYQGGQCLDTILKYIKTPEFKEIHRLWRLYHLNGMHAGTPKQEAFIQEFTKTQDYNYDTICKALEAAGIYEDNGYRYGTAWLYQSIPQEELEKINNLLK